MAELTKPLPEIDVIGEEEVDVPTFFPSQKEMDVVKDIFTKFSDCLNLRNQSFDYFDARDLITYIDDSVRRFITNVDTRDDIEDWQARVFDPFTRNKIIAILGKVAPLIPVPEFTAVGEEDFKREKLLTDLYQYADRIDDTEELMFYALLEATVKGTAIGYEGYEEKRTPVREVVTYDSGATMTVKEGTKVTRKLKGTLIPLEDFYPSSVGIRRIKDMPYCFWRNVMNYDDFSLQFAKYPKAQFVEPQRFTQENENTIRPFYKDYLSKSLPEGMIEVIRYYNQDTDQFVIIANGIWLNPLNTGEEVQPLPFAHKSLPFWSAIFEPFGSDFFYGKSLADKLKALQDVLNVLHNMMLDQSFLSIFPPILTEGMDEIEDDFLRPGRRIPVSNVEGYKELNISAPQGFHQYITEYTKRILEETSLDPVQQGVAGARGERVTATEIQRASEAVTGILGLFVMFTKWGVKDKARLKSKNLLQFYSKPLLEGVLGQGGTKKFNKAFNTFRLEDAALTSGKRGVKLIEMFKERADMPTKREQKLRAGIMEKETNKRVEIIAVDADYIRDFEYDIELVPNPRQPQSKALDKALALEKARVYMEFFPELVDKEELAMDIAEKFGDRPEKIIRKEVFESQQEGQQPPGAGGGLSKNIAKSALGGESANMSVANLATEA